ncbi:MAG: hypothetical protein FWG06_04745, partial [Clostridiales bacterium]|nr:hypothetical protein [Clostridiales bacterium]
MRTKGFSFKKFLRDNLFMLVFLFSAFATLVVSGITILSMNSTVVNMSSSKENMDTTKNFLISNYEYRLRSTAAVAQDLLSAGDLEKLRIKPGSPDSLEAWFENDDFLSLREQLIEFAYEYGLEFVYYYFRIDNYVQPVIDNDPLIENAYTPAHDIIIIDPEAKEAWNTKKVTAVTGEFFIDPDGLMTAYAPILDNKGEVVALVGVDIKDEQIYLLSGQIALLSARANALSERMTILIISMVAALLLLMTGGTLTFLANRKRARALNDALTQAQQASRAKSDFLANMSHEMRTPLNAVIGMTTIAKNASDAERKVYCLTKIEEASNHLLGVINDVLDYSKIEADKFELSLAEFNLEKILQKVCDVIAFKVAEKKQVFNVSIDMDIPAVLIGDDQHISQVIANFLSNAVKFTPDNGN